MTSSTRWTLAFRLFAVMIAAILLSGVVDNPVVTVYRIAGNSMRPSFQDGDRVLVANFPSLVGGVRVGDAVIADLHGETLIKRVVGLPGDTLEFVHGELLRNGEKETTAPPAEFEDDYSHGPIHLAANEYFLAGDNRRISIDSRTFGPLTKDAILGEVIYRFEKRPDARAHESAPRALGK